MSDFDLRIVMFFFRLVWAIFFSGVVNFVLGWGWYSFCLGVVVVFVFSYIVSLVIESGKHQQ